MTGLITEVCVQSVEGAVAAAEAGADRVELCQNLLEGGTTPSDGTIAETRARIDAGLMVIVRPRGGDFLYTDAEFAVMKRDVARARELGADGVVVGLLDAEGRVDGARFAELVALARPLQVTFHRAFDMARDPREALEAVIGAGADRLLTSGQEPSVLEGMELIADLVEWAAGRIVIMPGGGLTLRNAARVVAGTGVKEIHFARLEERASGMVFRNGRVFMGGELRPPEYAAWTTTTEGVKAMLDVLKK